MKQNRINLLSVLPVSARLASRFGRLIFTLALVSGALGIPSLAQETKDDPSRIIQYRGPMPLLPKEQWGREVKLKFELYRSPDGGASFWKETRMVSVRNDGWVAVDLGQVAALPDEAFTTPFRFLAIWHDKVEFVPRKQVASLAYVAAPGEIYLPTVNKASVQPSDGAKPLGQLVDCGTFRMEAKPRSPTTWLGAVASARQLGARLPTFEEWYGAYDGKASPQLLDMKGHYEWVIPWVYEPTIHARLHELYRGKSVACYYEELSPMNPYAFRLVEVGDIKPNP